MNLVSVITKLSTGKVRLRLQFLHCAGASLTKITTPPYFPVIAALGFSVTHNYGEYMLIIKYTYKDKRVELPVDLKIFPSIEDSKDVYEWDLLNYVASEISGESVELEPSPIVCERGGPRATPKSVDEVASEFGFSTLQLIDNNELAVFVV